MRALEVQTNVPLAPFCTLGVGGPARAYVRAASEDDLRAAAGWARARALPLFLLGGGSNLLVADEGFPGLVAHVDLRGVSVAESAGGVDVTAAAGEDWDALVARCVEAGWSGVECLSGIPGRVGATPIQNVGAYGQDVSATITSVRCLDLETGEAVVLRGDECGFGYRDSRFKAADRGRFAVLGVTFRLRRGEPGAPRYAELARALSGVAAPTVRDVRRTVLALRRAKSMVLDPADPNRRSAGSFFTNPTVDADTAAAVRAAAAGAHGPEVAAAMPAFDGGGGRVKLSAAWLIERAGLAKGDGAGPVGLSTNHTLAIVNRGGATAREVAAFARDVRERVETRFGVRLVPEPVLLGLDLGAS
ncbi:MAG: UDP-N-acetylmuramate dehydrogenase [Vicinamibacteria bacterium]